MSVEEPTPTGYPPARVLAFLSFLVIVASAACAVLYIVTPASQRPNLWAALPGLITFVPAALAWLRGEQNRKQLAVVTRNTNGVLDSRIQEQSTHAMRAVLAEHGFAPVFVPPQTRSVPVTPAPAAPTGA